MSRLLNTIGSFFPILQKDFKIYDGEIFSEVYDGDFYKNIPFENYINFNSSVTAENAYYIRDFGAIADNSSVNNAAAINSAIKVCSENGGGIVVVDGGSYTSGTVFLQSNVLLYIAKESAITASHNIGDFRRNSPTLSKHVDFITNGLIYAENCENIAITGPGKICGEGNYFSLAPALPPKTEPFKKALDVWDMRQEYRKRIRFAHKNKYGFLVHLRNCRQVRLHNLILENSSSWTLNLNNCNGVQVTNTVINNNRHIANTDGIDISGSSNVTIKKCFVSTADDGIVLKNSLDTGCDKAMSNIYITDCEVISCTNAFKIGTETSLDISDVTVENCKFYLNDIFPGGVSAIAIESSDGASVKNISVSDIFIDSVACPLFIRLNNRNRDNRPEFDRKGMITGVKVKNISAKNAEIPTMIMGIPTQKINGVELADFSIEYAKGRDYYDYRLKIPEQEKEYPECNRFRNINAYGIFVRHAENISLENFNVTPRERTRRKFKIIIDCENFNIK
ncbi:MAG: right-handed parallel beta-helix repeat-containing protein [Oscillospiraceae bacterium]|nr:right-handed parallel beta-helix repeat-containing protein [Oscillospiraceae bacterium]